MKVDLKLSELSLAEKWEIMDTVWEDIRHHPDEIPSPDWHGEILRVRIKRVEEGKEEILDWEKAKALLDKETAG